MIMIRCHLVFIAFLGLAAAWGQEEPSSPQPPPPALSESYLRVANLMPLGTERAEILRGDVPLLGEMKPGFVMPYIALAKEGPWTFQVRWGGSAVGSFKIDPAIVPGFHTVVLVPDGARARLVFSEDTVPPPKEGDFSFPARRFRAFLPAIGFNYTLHAGELGSWEISRQSQVVDVPVTGLAPKEVKLTYTSREGDIVDLFFPADFAAHPRQAVFVSQRGIQRPRVRVVADNVKPMDESVAAPDGP